MIKWLGYPQCEATWEKGSELKMATETIEKFEKRGKELAEERVSNVFQEEELQLCFNDYGNVTELSAIVGEDKMPRRKRVKDGERNR